MSFDGLPHETIDFLRELRANNNRPWFNDNYERYQAVLVEPARALVVALGALLRVAVPGLVADPKVGGSILRITRDTRFTRDKTPYKTRLELWFWEGSGPGRDYPGYYFRLAPDSLTLGAGERAFRADLLEGYRAAVDDPVRGRALEQVLAAIRASGPYDVGVQGYKRVPAGFPPDHPRAALLQHEGLVAGVEMPVPEETFSSALPAFCMAHYRVLAPLERWLSELHRSGKRGLAGAAAGPPERPWAAAPAPT
jgi:uncharacterized protein (TIGR02453 family)